MWVVDGWVGVGQPRDKNRHVICVEDPFDVETDLGRYVDETTLKDIVGKQLTLKP